MVWYPKYKLYASDGNTLIYQFDFVIFDSSSPNNPIRFTEITGSRGQGSIIVEGPLSVWDLDLTIHLQAIDYISLIEKMDSLENTIVLNTPYVLKIDRTISSTKNYNVKRINTIQWENTNRVRYQKCVITFRVNTW